MPDNAPTATDTTLTADLWARLTEALGMAADANPETVVVAVEELTIAPGSENAVAAAAVLASAGRSALDQLRADAEQGRVLAAAARKRDITDKVEIAFRRGAITVPDKKHWTALIEADPTKADVLASLPNEFAVNLSEKGYGMGNEGEDDIVDAAPWFR